MLVSRNRLVTESYIQELLEFCLDAAICEATSAADKGWEAAMCPPVVAAVAPDCDRI